MSNVVNVDFITKVVEIEVNDNETESLAAMAAVNAAKRADEKVAVAIDEIDDFTDTKKAELQVYADNAANSATAASNSASSASTTARALTDIYNEAISSGQIVAPAVDPTLAISGAAADARITGGAVKNGIVTGSEGTENFVGLTLLSRGRILNTGEIVRDYTSRIVTDYIQKFPYGITLNIADGFRYIIVYYTEGVYSSSTVYLTGSTYIKANQEFRVCILRVTEDASEVADISLFGSQLTFTSNIGQKLDNIENLGIVTHKNLTADDVIDGYGILDNGNTYANANYVCTDYIDISNCVTDKKIKLASSLAGIFGTAFYNAEKSLIYSVYGNNAGDYGFTTGTQVRYYTIPSYAKYMRATYAKADGYSTPNDFSIEWFEIPKISTTIDIATNGVKYNNLNNELKTALAPEYSDLDITFSNTDHYARYDNGNVISYSGINCSDYIDLQGATKIKVSGQNFGSCTVVAFYDTSHTFIEAHPNVTTSVTYSNEIINVPSNAKYIIANNYNGATRVSVLAGYKASGTLGKWANKTWVCFGDSLTAINAPTNKRYFDYIVDVTGITTVNMGSSGTGYGNDGGDGRAFHQRIANVPSCDVVTIFGSFNDMASGLPLGNATDSGTSTLAGCMNTTFDGLFAIHPTVQLGVISPTPWETLNPLGQPNSASAYCDMIKTICSMRGIPYLDLFHNSGLRPWDATYRTLVYSKDQGMGVHPNELGHAIIAPHIEAFLDTLLLH